jgi:hypothetical protein
LTSAVIIARPMPAVDDALASGCISKKRDLVWSL